MNQGAINREPHEKLAVFLGDWPAEGTSYGGDERANGSFDTLSLMGWDADTGRYFARTIENHNFVRDYTTTVDGRIWTLSGEHARATYRSSEDGRTQEIPGVEDRRALASAVRPDRPPHRLTLPNPVVLANRDGADALVRRLRRAQRDANA